MRTKQDPATLPMVERRRLAVRAALDMLARRDRTEAEVAAALKRKGFDGDTIAVVAAKLKESKLLDDARFAEAFAEHAGDGRGYAASMVRLKLRQKGVDAETAAAAAAAAPEDEAERARLAAARRARALGSYPREVRYRRLAGFLARRGYPPSIVSEVARELADDDGGGSAPPAGPDC